METINLYAVYDSHNRKLSEPVPYQDAQKIKKLLVSMHRVGTLQAIVAIPPFSINKVKA
jgi:hypothetical protein